jgi:hypothetical protein
LGEKKDTGEIDIVETLISNDCKIGQFPLVNTLETALHGAKKECSTISETPWPCHVRWHEFVFKKGLDPDLPSL